eukprot:gene23208-30422_t
MKMMLPKFPRLLRARHTTMELAVDHLKSGNAVMISQFLVASQEVADRRVVDEELLMLLFRNQHSDPMSDEMRTVFYGVVPSDSRAGVRAELRAGVVRDVVGPECIVVTGGPVDRFVCAIENTDIHLITSMLADDRVREAIKPLCRRGSALIAACKVGNLAVVKMLLEHPVLAARADCQHNAPIFHARSGGHESVVQMLVADENHPAIADIRSPLGRTCKSTVRQKEAKCNSHLSFALMAACRRGGATLVGDLLETGTYPPRADVDDHQALIIACKLGHVGVVEQLLRPGDHAAHAGARNSLGFVLASQGGHKPVVRLLLDQGVPANSANSAAVWHASACGHIGLVRLLLHGVAHPAKADERHEGCTPLMIASQKGHGGVVGVLVETLSKTSQPDHRYKECLYVACASGYEEVARVLLTVTKADEKSLSAASRWGHTRIVDRLIHRGFDHRSPNCSALWYACEKGFVRIAKMLLQIQPVMRYYPASHQMSLLEVASKNGRHLVVQLLLEYRNIYTQADVGAAVVASVKRGSVETVVLLMSVVEPSASWDQYRRTAIEHARGAEMLDLL